MKKTKAELNEQALTINFQEQQIWRETESDEAKSERIREALRALQTDPLNPVYFYIAGVFADVVVINAADSEYYAYGYEDDGETVTLGEPQRVERTFIPADVQAEVEEAMAKLKNRTIQETRADGSKHQIEEITETIETVLTITEEKGKAPRIKGKAITAGVIGENGTRYDKEKVLKPAIEEALKTGLPGLAGHPKVGPNGKPQSPTVSDVVGKFTDLHFEGDVLHYEAEIVETAAGKDLLACARAGVPIKNSIRGEGDWDIVEESASGQPRMVKDVLPGYKFKSIDFILEDPAFAGSGATSFEEQKKQEEEMEELKKLQEQVAALEKKLAEASAKSLDEPTVAELRASLSEAKARTKAAELVETKENADAIKGFEDVAKRQLSEAKTPEDVEKLWPAVKATILEMKGRQTKPTGTGRVEILGEGEIKVPHSPEEAFAYLTEIPEKSPLWKRFQETKHIPRTAPNWMINPKLVVEQLVKNYVMDKGKVSQLFENSRRNPLRVLCEAVGDNETYTGDIASTGAALLPLILPVYERLLMNEVCSVQPLDRPSGAAFFKKSYYEDTGGDPALHDGVDYDYADKAEDSGGAQITTKILTNAITLKTPKKLNFPWTIEAEKSLLAYHGINMDSMVIQDGRDEIAREINAYVLYLMLTATSLSNSDNAVVAANVDFDATPEAGWKYDEWLRFKLPEAIAQAGASMYGKRYVKPTFGICDEDAAVYLAMLNGFNAGDAQNFGIGINRIGTYQQTLKVYEAAGFTANKLLLGYKGPGIFDAGFAFLPFVLFEILDLVTDPATYEKVRPMWSWYAAEKLIGYMFATVTIIPAT